MQRRKFITLLGGGAAVAWPLAARAQRAYRLGILTGRGRQEPNYVAFFDELRQFGIAEGQHLTVDPRGFEAPEDQFSALANELVASGVNAIQAAGDLAIKAAQAATRSTPVLGVSGDMVAAGLVRSLARPTGNITGISILATELDSKRLELLMEVFKDTRRMAALSDPNETGSRQHLEILRNEAHSHGVELAVYEASTPEEIVPAIDAASRAGAQALNVLSSALFSWYSRRIVEHTLALRLPTIHQWPEIADGGGLLAYGPRITLIYRQLARQLIKLMHDVKPADIPVEQPTVFELVVNLKTAQAMGLDLPATFLTRADAVIE
jgi:putative tryptophan/tyrosine transport system substrate-binding protein